MFNKRRCFLLHFTIVLLALMLSGCADTVKNMRAVPSEKAVTGPEKGKAMVVFMRPSIFGVTLESSIYEINGEAPSLIGTLVAVQKLSYQLEPGKHLFMVAANNIDYMPAELKADKTYYVRIAPIMGKWVGRFRMVPMPINLIYSTEFYGWLEECEEVEKIAASDDETASDIATLQSRHKEHYAKWIKIDASKRVGLLLRDGK